MRSFTQTVPAPASSRRSLSVLDTVRIAVPCPAEWTAMLPVAGQPYQRVRHCQQCNLRVYDLSALHRADAEALLRASEGRLCARLYRRHDGTVLTADCTFFCRAMDAAAAGARRAGWLAVCALAAVVGLTLWAGSFLRASGRSQTTIMQGGFKRLTLSPPFDRFYSWTEQSNVTAGIISFDPVTFGETVAPADAPPPELLQAGPGGRDSAEAWFEVEINERVPL